MNIKQFFIELLFRDCLHCNYYDIHPQLIMGWDYGYCILYEKNVKNTGCCESWEYRWGDLEK